MTPCPTFSRSYLFCLYSRLHHRTISQLIPVVEFRVHMQARKYLSFSMRVLYHPNDWGAGAEESRRTKERKSNNGTRTISASMITSSSVRSWWLPRCTPRFLLRAARTHARSRAGHSADCVFFVFFLLLQQQQSRITSSNVSGWLTTYSYTQSLIWMYGSHHYLDTH